MKRRGVGVREEAATLPSNAVSLFKEKETGFVLSAVSKRTLQLASALCS